MIHITQELVAKLNVLTENFWKLFFPLPIPKESPQKNPEKLVFRDEKKYNKELHFLLK